MAETGLETIAPTVAAPAADVAATSSEQTTASPIAVNSETATQVEAAATPPPSTATASASPDVVASPSPAAAAATAASEETTAAPGIAYAGYLSKRSHDGLRYQKRYFMLTTSNAVCYSMKKMEGLSGVPEKGVTSWAYEDIVSATLEGKGHFLLVILEQDKEEKKQRVVSLKGSDEEVTAWLEKLAAVGIKPAPTVEVTSTPPSTPVKAASSSAVATPSTPISEESSSNGGSASKKATSNSVNPLRWFSGSIKFGLPKTKEEETPVLPPTVEEVPAKVEETPAPGTTTETIPEPVAAAAPTVPAEPETKEVKDTETLALTEGPSTIPEWPVAQPLPEAAPKQPATCGWLFSMCMTDEDSV